MEPNEHEIDLFGMTSEEFQKLRNLFDRIAVATDPEQEIFLEDLARRDARLAGELKRMLDARRQTSLLDNPAAPFMTTTSMTEDLETPSDRYAGYADSSLGGYHLEKELGRGGMGVVYRAQRADGAFHKQVAIKILRHDRVDPHFVRRFHQEREILAQLNHPHIASILDGGSTTDGDPYFVMEYVDGVPVTTYCQAHGLTVDQTLDLFLQICDAIQHAHRNLTVHRDLKPSNILVTPAGAVKLLDFGIAKLLQPVTDLAVPAATEAILTPDYTSPEQIRRAPITTAADVFSLGILLYEMLTGEHPFRATGRLPHEVMNAICQEDPTPPSALARSRVGRIRGELDTIVLTALRKDPAWRYPSVEQLARDIGRYRRGWPVLAKGDSLAYRLRKFARRQWLPLTAAAVVMAALLIGILMTTRQARIAEQARESADRARMQAEQDRAEATAQRIRAEQAQTVATEQRHVAESRTEEAERERSKEQARYRDVRGLAASLLFELHDGIRDLAGSTTARRLIVGKAQRQLELLSADAGNDIELQRDLAAAYERMGELRVDPRQPNKNDAAAALDSYRRAVELRKTIAQRKEALPGDRRDLALSIAKRAFGEFMASEPKQSLESYNAAWTQARDLVKSAPSDASMRKTLGTIDERRCVALLTTGNTSDSIASCQEGIATLSPLVDASPNDVEIQRLIASTQGSYANALRLSQKPQEAAAQAQLALKSLRRLELLAPNNAEYRRLSSSAESILALSLAATGAPGSLEAFRRSVDASTIAMEIDPSDLGSSLRLAVTLRAFSRRLASSGDRTAARDTALEALRLLEQTSNKPGAGAVEWNEYADALLKVEWPDLVQPAKALDLARNAVSATNRTNPFFLDTLAWAYFRSGDAVKAADTEREALHLLPANAKGGLGDELRRGLSAFTGETR